MTSTSVTEPDVSTPRRWHRRFVVPLAFAVSGAVLGTVALVLQAMGASTPPGARPGPSAAPVAVPVAVPAPSGSRFLIAIACPPGGADAAAACDRIGIDRIHRARLSDEERAFAQQQVRAVDQAVAVPQHLGRQQCDTMTRSASGRPCAFIPDPFGRADVTQILAALRAAGFATATVRVATTTDPAPVGALLYAVPVGNACVIGYEVARPGWGSGPNVVGRLPDGSCLRG